MLLGKWPKGVKRYSGNIRKYSLFSLLSMPSQLSSPESLMCSKKSGRSRRHGSFLYLTMYPDPELSSGEEKTQFQPLKNSEMEWGHTYNLNNVM